MLVIPIGVGSDKISNSSTLCGEIGEWGLCGELGSVVSMVGWIHLGLRNADVVLAPLVDMSRSNRTLIAGERPPVSIRGGMISIHPMAL